MRRRRSRVRRVLKWAATVACGLTLAGMVACLHWRRMCIACDRSDFFLEGGALIVLLPPDGDVFKWPSKWAYEAVEAADWHEIDLSWSRHGAWPRSMKNTLFHALAVPLWIPLAFFGALTGWLWWRDRRRSGPGGCLTCGYDLTGNVSGRCPECGMFLSEGTEPLEHPEYRA